MPIRTSFVNLSQIFTILGILVNNETVDMSHDFCCHGNHFGRKRSVTLVTKNNIKLAGTGEYRVYTSVIRHWKADVFSILMVFEDLLS